MALATWLGEEERPARRARHVRGPDEFLARARPAHHQIFDRVRDITTTSGTGAITLLLTPPAGYQPFGNVMCVGDATYYCVADQGGPNWETGVGTLTASNLMARTTVLESSNGGQLVNFGAGTKDIFLTAPAAHLKRTTLTVTNNATAAIKDDLILFQTDNAVSPILTMYSPPWKGQKLTAIWVSGIVPPRIQGTEGIGVEDVNSPGTLVPWTSTTTLRAQGQRATWEFDGGVWRLLPGS